MDGISKGMKYGAGASAGAAGMRAGMSLLGGLVQGKKSPIPTGGNYLMSRRDQEQLARGVLPAGWSLGEDGRARPMVQ